ncbi:MAG: rod shape-determining protein [Acidobacteriota bacterium]|nr:rod shape-determining protein [Acidobacteriota bacterium]
MKGIDLAIDLGTANTCVFAHGSGVVVNEPSIVAFNMQKRTVEAVGHAAREMLGRTPPHIRAVRPLRDGVIADFDAAEQMLKYFVRMALPGLKSWMRPRMVIGVPSEITQVERRAVRDSAIRARASEVHLVDEPIAAAIGVGMPVSEPVGNMIVDIGGGTTDIAVISLSGVVYSRSVRIGGDAMDEAIILYAKRRHQLLIGERTAESVKLAIGSATPLGQPVRMEVKGRHVSEGVPRIVEMTDEEIRGALADPVRGIVQAIMEALEQVPPELAADIYDRGLTLSGGGALLRNLDKRVRQETGLPVQVAEDPLSSVVLGAGRMLNDTGLLRRMSASGKTP